MKKSILFIEAGRREELISRFHRLGAECYSLEISKRVPLPKYVKIIKCRPWADGYGVSDLRDMINVIEPDLVVPCSCKSSAIYSQMELSKSTYSPQEICYDKKRLQNAFQNCSFYPAAKWDGDNLIIKPRFGNGGKDVGVRFGATYKDYQSFDTLKYVAQKFIQGKEYSVDCFYDEFSNLIEAVPRERLKVVSGEVIESITVEKQNTIDVVKEISKKISLTGPICMQFMEDENGKIWLIEINHRFGGGSTLSIEAGMNAPLWMLYPETAKNHEFGSYKRGLYLIRNYRDYYYETKTEISN